MKARCSELNRSKRDVDDRHALLRPNHKPTPRHPRAGEHLWTVQKNGRQLACELRDDGEAGVEVQVYRDRAL